MSKSLAKQFYLEQLRINPSHHRIIANRMVERFSVSPAMVKDELLADGYIKLDKVVRMGETRKNNYFFVLTGKKFALNQEPEKKVSSVDFWPCGTKKSTGNAFDLSLAKGNSTVQVIAYSRA